MQTEWLSGEGIKNQHVGGLTCHGTVSGFSLRLVGAVAFEPVAKQRTYQGRDYAVEQAPSWHPGSTVRRGGASALYSVTSLPPGSPHLLKDPLPGNLRLLTHERQGDTLELDHTLVRDKG